MLAEPINPFTVRPMPLAEAALSWLGRATNVSPMASAARSFTPRAITFPGGTRFTDARPMIASD